MRFLALALLSAVLLGPLLIVEVPPVLDYPNHLARLVLLASGPDDPVLGPIFTPNWSIIPNLAGDVIGLGLLRVLPAHVAGRCLLGVVMLLNLAGVVALHRAWFGRRSWWPLGYGLVAYNSGFLLGFLNWQLGAGLAMLFAAGWMLWRDHRPGLTIAGGALAACVLFFCHLMGLVFFLVLIGSAEARARRPLLTRGAGLLAVMGGPLLLWASTALRDVPTETDWPRLDVKLVNAVSPFINYVFWLDMLTAALVYGGVVLGVATGRLRVAPRAVPALAALTILYFALPFDFMSSSFLDMRVALMVGFLLFAAIEPARLGRAVVAIGVLMFVVRMGVIATVWSEHRHDLSQLRAAIAAVPPGAKVWFTNVPQEEAPAYWDAGPYGRRLSNGLRADYHLPALLLIERGAFWPVLFANPAQQPIRLRPDYEALAREGHDLPSHAVLAADPDGVPPALRDFDFVLMLESGADPALANFIPRCLKLETSSDFAALFRVERSAPACKP